MTISEHRILHARLNEQRNSTFNMIGDYKEDSTHYLTKSNGRWEIRRCGVTVSRGIWQ